MVKQIVTALVSHVLDVLITDNYTRKGKLRTNVYGSIQTRRLKLVSLLHNSKTLRVN